MGIVMRGLAAHMNAATSDPIELVFAELINVVKRDVMTKILGDFKNLLGRLSRFEPLLKRGVALNRLKKGFEFLFRHGHADDVCTVFSQLHVPSQLACGDGCTAGGLTMGMKTSLMDSSSRVSSAALR